MAAWRDLATAIEGTVESENGLHWVLARRKGCDVIVLGSETTLLTVQFVGDFLDPADELESLCQRGAFQSLLKNVAYPLEGVRRSAERDRLVFFFSNRPKVPGVASLTAWLVEVTDWLDPQILLREPQCECCGTFEASKIRRSPVQAVRRCDSCQKKLTTLVVELQSLPGRPPEKPQLQFFQDLTRPEFEQKAQALQAQQVASPVRFWLWLVGLVLLGQLALASGAVLLVLSLAFLVFFVCCCLYAQAWQIALMGKALASAGGKLMAPLALLFAGLGKSVASWVRGIPDEQPQGQLVGRTQAPRLYAKVDELTGRLQAPAIAEIYLVPAFNAAAQEYRTWWGYRRRLILGIPLLENLSESELEVVLSHELAHFCYGDTRSIWIHRTAAIWYDVGARLDKPGNLSYFTSFARWYLPHFMLRANVISRAQEFRADSHSESNLPPGSPSGASVLAKLAVWDVLYGEELIRVARRQQGQTFDYVQSVTQSVANVPRRRWQLALEKSLDEPTQWWSSHPSLKERLENLGSSQQPEFTTLVEGDCKGLFDEFETLRSQVLGPFLREMQIRTDFLALFRSGRQVALDLLAAHEASSLRDRMCASLLIADGREEEALALLEPWLADPEGPVTAGEREFVSCALYCHRPEQVWARLEKRWPEPDCDIWVLATALEVARAVGLAEPDRMKLNELFQAKSVEKQL